MLSRAPASGRWVQDEETQLWRLEPVYAEVETVDGIMLKPVPLVPRPVALMEYAIMAAIGHKSIPKGGDPEYMNGPWYKPRREGRAAHRRRHEDRDHEEVRRGRVCGLEVLPPVEETGSGPGLV